MLRSLRILALACAALALSACGPSASDCGPHTRLSGDHCVLTADACGANERFDPATATCVATRACSAGTRPDADGNCVPDLKDDFRGGWAHDVLASPEGSSRSYFLEPSLAADGHGHVVVASMHDSLQGVAVDVFASHDDGLTFARVLERRANDDDAVTVADGVPLQAAFCGDVALAVGADGAFYLAWVDYFDRSCPGSACDPWNAEATAGAVRVRRSADGGVTWGPMATVDSAADGSFMDRPFLSVADDGALWVSYIHAPLSSEGPEVFGSYLARATVDAAANTTSWTVLTPTLVDGGSYCEAPVVVRGGSVVGAYEAIEADGSSTVIVNALPAGAESGSGNAVASAAVDTSQNVREVGEGYGVFATVAPLPGGGYATTFRKRHDGAFHLASVVVPEAGSDEPLSSVQVDDGAAATVLDPFLVADSTGVHAAWYDDRDGHWAVYSSSSTDGVHWTRNARVSDVPFDESGRSDQGLYDFLGLWSTGERLYVAWADARAGSSAIHVASAANPLK